MALTRTDIEQACKQLVEGIRARREAIYPPGEKRNLPADIPTLQQMRDLRKLIITIRTGMLAMHDDIEPRKRPTGPLKLKDAMIAFLDLPASFEGYYKRELLVKAINIYASVKGLVVDGGIVLDEALATATGKTEGDELPRQQIFGLVSLAFDTSIEPSQRVAVHPRVFKMLEKEREELQSISDATAIVRRTKQQRDNCLSSPHKLLLEREARAWSLEVTKAEEALLQCIGKTRLFADVTEVLVEVITDTEIEE